MRTIKSLVTLARVSGALLFGAAAPAPAAPPVATNDPTQYWALYI